jgi:outer membrane protein assembly factor BamB
MSVVGDTLYTIGGRDETEYLIALDISTATPRQLWAAEVGPLFQWEGNRWSAGPSATPTIDGELIYAQGGLGDLVCARAKDGKQVWRKNLPADLAAEVNPIGGGPKKLGWGFTCSPLVDGQQLIILPGGPGGTVAALDKLTGELLWRSAEVTDQAAYTSPVIATTGGVRHCIVLTNQGVFAVSPDDGKLLWNYRRRFSTEVINTPLIRDNLVFVTVGAGQGCELLRIERDGDAFTPELVYSNKNLLNHHGNVVLVAGYLYGHSDGKGWTCQNLESGEVAWAERMKLRGAGSLVYADGKLYLYSETDGTVVLLAATPEGWQESGRFKIPQQSTLRRPVGKIWTPPIISRGRLFLRDQELLFCYEVGK